MAGITDAAFRGRLRRNGCKRLFTEMVSAAALARGNRKTASYLAVPDAGEDLGVQLFGADAEELAAAATMAEEAGFRHVDLNMGCPVRKVVRGGAGAALLGDPARASRCLNALRRAVHGTLSVKLRSGWDERSVNCIEMGRLAEACGVDRITLHPRTRSQGYGGNSDWRLVAALVEAVSVPVVGNGDVTSAEEAVRRLEECRCAGVMIGRAALGEPWIFRDAEARCAGREPGPPPTPAEIGADLLVQMDDVIRWKGERVAAFEMRKFAAWSAHGLVGAARFRRQIHATDGADPLRREVTSYFATASRADSGRGNDSERGRERGRLAGFA
jgi:nifR3 family TIM-barrel protein